VQHTEPNDIQFSHIDHFSSSAHCPEWAWEVHFTFSHAYNFGFGWLIFIQGLRLIPESLQSPTIPNMQCCCLWFV